MSPVLDGVLAGIATAWSYCFVLLQFVRAQARLSTMSGSILDLMAFDFFGATLTRRPGEGDLEFSARVRSNLLLPRATRQATSDMMQTLTGLAPVIFEPRRGSDAGAYGSPWLGYGSNVMPFQYLITIDAAGPSVRRETEASYIDQAGQLKLAPRHALRPLYANGAASSALIESRSWNLIKDSVAWSGFSPADPGSVAAWGIDNSDPLGLWPNQPVLRMTIGGSGLIVGPSVSAYIGTGAACASIWVLIPSGHTLISLAVSVTDGLLTTVAPGGPVRRRSLAARVREPGYRVGQRANDDGTYRRRCRFDDVGRCDHTMLADRTRDGSEQLYSVVWTDRDAGRRCCLHVARHLWRRRVHATGRAGHDWSCRSCWQHRLVERAIQAAMTVRHFPNLS